jgi:hypothetical protein
MHLTKKMHAIPPSLMKSSKNNVRLLERQGNKLKINFESKMMSALIKTNFNGQNSSHQFIMKSKGNTSIGSIAT